MPAVVGCRASGVTGAADVAVGFFAALVASSE